MPIVPNYLNTTHNSGEYERIREQSKGTKNLDKRLHLKTKSIYDDFIKKIATCLMVT
jgi:hypothetical protein